MGSEVRPANRRRSTRRLRFAERVFGHRVSTVRRAWWRFRAATPWEPNRALRVARRFVRTKGLTVRKGPFAGMKYHRGAIGATVLVPKLIGSYEQELHPILDEVIRQSCPTVINIGSGDGYYAIGLALKLPDAQVHAFELDCAFRGLSAKMASTNDVADRVTLHGPATAKALARVVRPPVFVLCDCEGCEVEVLDPAVVPPLKTASILVELHEFVKSGISERVMTRFRSTHTIQVIDSEPRDPRAYEELVVLSERDAALAVDEFRPERMQWAWMKPRTTIL